ncbi:ABC-F family ATP-binding cassette domain-containing protein [uncultured Tateyamaria sp.]|uniref:ABC-F family ATP-binding cassette domain-containing protein n=1 Tax=uncultured Tateyamaria sp. TaxID=455651 RepID=UPI002628269D|nr:ABC-F family ATP-binding cassette domain-containing protein [uncultured Tateyamaria sp.]
MAILHSNALAVTLSSTLFSDLSFTISKGNRIGLVAQNGSGKSTLLSCLAGEIDQTSGEITRARGLRIGFVTQDLPTHALSYTMYDWVLAALPSEQVDYESWRVDVVLNDLSVPYEFQHRSLAELSGGWQRMAMLAAVWVNEPGLLLLDEPTNHLDLQRIAALESWMAALPSDLPVLMTSHDRAFLDAVTNGTLFLRPEQSRFFALPFSAARAALEEADMADARRFANDLNKAQQLRKQAAKLKNVGVNSGSDLLLTKTKQLTERANKIEAAARPAHKGKNAGDIKLSNSGTHAKALIALDDVVVKTPDNRLLYRTGKKWISPGDRVVLLGANGAGKTQMVKMIARALDGEDTTIRCAASAVAGYSDQHLSQLSDDDTPMRAVTHNFDIGDQRARGVLAGAGVSYQMQDTRIGALSGGQKARLTMLVLRLKNPNFYLLDEPTNHLDIDGQEALENELIDRDTSCLLVSHDRRFLRNVGNRFWCIQGQALQEVDSPDDFLNAEMQTP